MSSNNSINRNQIKDSIRDILENAHDSFDSDDSDYWCDECNDQYNEEEHYDECECECHDEQGFIESCVNRITQYIVVNFATNN
jgi:Zn finger protein HypA/HybF involved in hydrogenase expression